MFFFLRLYKDNVAGIYSKYKSLFNIDPYVYIYKDITTEYIYIMISLFAKMF